MEYFYDGQIRRYLTQIIRTMSNFVVRYSDGTLVEVPVMYGDPDRQVAHIISQNSENTLVSAPRIAVYISDLDLARERLADSTYVGKLNIREREIDPVTGDYNSNQGNNFTVERLMPTPYDLTVKVDIWATSTDQKLQILEQILTLFNPSLELQTTDNYIDWTSISVLELMDVIFSSRSVPVGTNTAIDIATISFKAPIYISAPAKVKKLGVITNIIANVGTPILDGPGDYIDGLGTDPNAGQQYVGSGLFTQHINIGNTDIFVEGSNVKLLTFKTNSLGGVLTWPMVLAQYPGKFTAGVSKIFLRQPGGNDVVGVLSQSILDENTLIVNWDEDTFASNTAIPGPARAAGDWGFFDAIVDPTTFNPKRPNKERVDQPIPAGRRYLIVDNVGGNVTDSFVASQPTQYVYTNVPHWKVRSFRLLVDGVEVGANPQSNPIYYNVAGSLVDGVGTGATFNITAVLSTQGYTATIANGGTGFVVGDKIRVRGKKLSGINIEHDCVITVKTVDGSGAITDIKVGGQSAPKDFVVIPDTVIASSSVITYELNLNEDGPDAWKNLDNSDFVATAQDIIEWDGTKWQIIFSADLSTDVIVYQTNIFTGTQYKWNGIEWVKSFEGEYKRGQWRIAL